MANREGYAMKAVVYIALAFILCAVAPRVFLACVIVGLPIAAYTGGLEKLGAWIEDTVARGKK